VIVVMVVMMMRCSLSLLSFSNTFFLFLSSLFLQYCTLFSFCSGGTNDRLCNGIGGIGCVNRTFNTSLCALSLLLLFLLLIS